VGVAARTLATVGVAWIVKVKVGIGGTGVAAGGLAGAVSQAARAKHKRLAAPTVRQFVQRN